MQRKTESDLATAAAALDAELESFEALAATLRKMPLASKKHIDRAARSLQEAAGYEERIAGRLRALVEAIHAASERQQQSAASIVARAREIEARNAEYDELFARWAALGDEAQEITTLGQEIIGPIREATSPEQKEKVGEKIDELIVRLTTLGERAQDIARAAVAKEMTELGRDADALRQQLAASRNRLVMVRQSQRPAPDRSN